MEEIAGRGRRTTGRGASMSLCSTMSMAHLSRSFPTENSPALFAFTTPFSILLSCSPKGARHRTALSRLKERGLMRQEEINKRVALSGRPINSTSPGISAQNSRLPSKPLIEQTRKVASEIFHTSNEPKDSLYEKRGVKCSSSTSNHVVGLDHCQVNSNYTVGADVATALPMLDFQELREKELKFTAAGWKRDCHGKW